jgi:hypothetical protein
METEPLEGIKYAISRSSSVSCMQEAAVVGGLLAPDGCHVRSGIRHKYGHSGKLLQGKVGLHGGGAPKSPMSDESVDVNVDDEWMMSMVSMSTLITAMSSLRAVAHCKTLAEKKAVLFVCAEEGEVSGVHREKSDRVSVA